MEQRSNLTLRTRYNILGVALIAPTLIIFGALIAYPLLSTIVMSLFSIYTPTQQGSWVGLQNYVGMFTTGGFLPSLVTTLIWTVGTLVLQIGLGVVMALLLNQTLVFRALARSLVLFPFFVSTVVAVLIWRWLFNDLFGILNYGMLQIGLLDRPLDWLGSMPNAMISVILVGGWKFFPFVTMAVLARLQTIPEALYEAATIDGAGPWSRFWDVTMPQLRDVLVIVFLLRAIWDFKDFDLIFLLTGGGPVTSTETLPLLVYKQAFGLNAMGMASAIAVGMMIVMLVFMSVYLWRARREKA